jgi:hypothetical protein
VQTHKTASCLDVTPENKPLLIRVKNVIVRAWEQEQGILIQVAFRENRWVFGYIHFESVRFA